MSALEIGLAVTLGIILLLVIWSWRRRRAAIARAHQKLKELTDQADAALAAVSPEEKARRLDGQ